MIFDLHGRHALVTGGGQGLGAEISRLLAAQGAAVAVNDLDAARADGVVTEIRAAGGDAVAAPADVTDQDAVNAMVDALEADGRAIDIVVNNAGIPPQGVGAGVFVESGPAQWKPMVDLNLYAVLYVVRRVLPGMVEREHGRIVTIVSDAARAGEPTIAVYAAAKAAAAAFSRSLAKEVGRVGVTSNCVSIASIAYARRDPEGMAREARRYPVGRLGTPQDIAPAVLLLASDESAWITGQTYGVDGGYVTS